MASGSNGKLPNSPEIVVEKNGELLVAPGVRLHVVACDKCDPFARQPPCSCGMALKAPSWVGELWRESIRVCGVDCHCLGEE